MPIPLNNPAARVHDVLRRALGQNGGTVLAVFAHVLELDPPDLPNFFRAWASLVDAAFLACDQILLVPSHNVAEYNGHLRRIAENLASMHHAHPWQNYAPQYDNVSMMALMVAADHLSHSQQEVEVPKADRDGVLQRIVALQKQVTEDTTLSEELRLFLLDLLQRMRLAFVEYPTRGAEALRMAVGTSLGALYLRNNELSTHREWVAYAANVMTIVQGIAGLVAMAYTHAPVMVLPVWPPSQLQQGDFPRIGPGDSAG